jgi:ABC-type glycerol-3-phosphate transport system permease component
MGIRTNEATVWKVTGYVFLVVMLMILAFPAVIALITSLKGPQEIYTTPPTWIPEQPRPTNYLDMFRVLPLGRAFFNSLVVSVGSAVLAMLAAVPAAYAL